MKIPINVVRNGLKKYYGPALKEVQAIGNADVVVPDGYKSVYWQRGRGATFYHFFLPIDHPTERVEARRV